MEIVAHNLGLVARKPVFGSLRTTQPFLFAFWKVKYVILLQVNFIFYLDSVAEETGLKLVLLEARKQVF